MTTKKAQEFLWSVQTGIISMMSEARRGDPDRTNPPRYSGSSAFGMMDDAVRALPKIPDDMESIDAASEYVTFQSNLGPNSRMPGWLQEWRFSNGPHYDYTHISKAEQFLWIVQTVIICDQENQASADADRRKPVRYSASRMLKAAQVAAISAEKIPENLSAGEAANAFTAHFVSTEKRTPPKWCVSA